MIWREEHVILSLSPQELAGIDLYMTNALSGSHRERIGDVSKSVSARLHLGTRRSNYTSSILSLRRVIEM
jgi:hypothetical protein